MEKIILIILPIVTIPSAIIYFVLRSKMTRPIPGNAIYSALRVIKLININFFLNIATSSKSNGDLSNDTKAIITILLILFLPPVGVIVMWAWMKSWPTWLKILLTLFGFGDLILIGLLVFGAMGWALFAVVGQQIKCENVCKTASDRQSCIVSCNKEYNPNPKAITTFNPDNLLIALNKDREGSGSDVGQLTRDNNLCLYAQRLAESYKNTGKDPQDQLDLDKQDSSVTRKYFFKYSRVYQQMADIPNFSTSDIPVEFRDYKGATRRAGLTNGCFAVIPSNQTNSSIIEFVGGITND